VSVGFISGAQAQTVVLEPVADTSISREETGESNGAGQHLFVGATGPGGGSALRRALVRFDLTSIPAEARITAVSLAMNVSKTNASAQNLTLTALTQGWGEGTSDASANEGQLTSATAGDSTWLMRIFPATAWTTQGGTIAGTIDASISSNGLGTRTWTCAAMVATAQGWLASPDSNNGWLVRNTVETGSNTSIRFDSSENPTAANRPKLTVTYVMPTVLVDTTSGLDTFNSVFVQGNGNSGFGGPVGGGRLYLDSDFNEIVKIGIQKGGGNLNDVLVLYFDSVDGGEASTAAYTDSADGSRVAISGVSGANRTTLTFPSGFRPDYALAYDARFGAFLFELSSGGTHRFVATVADAGAAANATAELTMLMSDIGLEPGDRFAVIGTYLSDTAFRSDEFFGPSVVAGNPGFGPVVLPAASHVIFQSVESLCVPVDCDDDNECTADVCTAVGCTNEPELSGAPCAGGFCDGEAVPLCVECVAAGDCDDDDTCTDDVCAEGVCANTDNGTCQVEPGPEVVEAEPEVELVEVAEVVEVVEESEPVVEVVEESEPVAEVAEVVEVVEESEPQPETIEPSPEVVEPGPEVVEPGPEVVEPSPEVVEPSPEVEVKGGSDSCGSSSGAGGALTYGLLVVLLLGMRRYRHA
jgi:hypothetical protein